MRKRSSRIVTAGMLPIFAMAGCNAQINLVGGYSFDYQGNVAERATSDSFDSTVTELEIDHRFGDVAVVASDGPPRWTWKLRCWATEQTVADAYLDVIYLQVQSIEDKQSWKIVLPEDADDLRGLRSQLTIEAPPSVDVKIVNEHGNVDAAGIIRPVQIENRHGNVQLSELADHCNVSNAHGRVTARGVAAATMSNQHGSIEVVDAEQLQIRGSHADVHVEQVSGNVSVETSHGGVKVSDSQGDLTLSTAHAMMQVDKTAGSLTLENQHGGIAVVDAVGDIVAKTSHAAIALDVASRNVECEAGHSNVELLLSNSDVESVKATTTHGNIEVVAPADLAVDVDARADHGRMVSDFPNVSDDTAAIVLRTTHGDIRIRKGLP